MGSEPATPPGTLACVSCFGLVGASAGLQLPIRKSSALLPLLASRPLHIPLPRCWPSGHVSPLPALLHLAEASTSEILREFLVLL